MRNITLSAERARRPLAADYAYVERVFRYHYQFTVGARGGGAAHGRRQGRRKVVKTVRSDEIKLGVQRAPHRSLLRALGVSDAEMEQPFIGIVNSFSEVVPGHMHLRQIVDAVKAGVRNAGGTPFEFGVPGICDGIAMNHSGMLYSLPSRELIADSVEAMTIAHAFDALVLVPCCDKIVPGMLMAAMRLNVPASDGTWRARSTMPA
jgi:dihydroxyacid dehydratase/phosphogluconate dehydratase